jgi:hypothetical protein
MKVNDFIAVRFPQEENKAYYAIITNMMGDDRFKCTFVHSGNTYVFKKYSGWLEVMETTGLFPVGTRTNEVILFAEAEHSLSANSNVRVSFEDGKSYLGAVKNANPLEISFLHSGNSYTFDANNVAHKSGGPYDGKRALEMKPYSTGNSLFSAQSEHSISLTMRDAFGRPLRGEFDVVVKRTDNNQVVFDNREMSAEDSTANAALNTALADGQRLMISVSFHPAVQPYDPRPNSSSVIDRNTSITGSETFDYRNVSELHFDIAIENETSTVTASTKEEAINTKYRELSQSSSHTFETHFEGEAGIKLFGIGGTVTGGGGTSDTDTHGSTEGSSDGVTRGTEVATTYTVYYPRGLKIKPSF